MKRNLTNSRAYLPPRVRVVEAYAESTALAAVSKVRINSQFSVDELENMNIEDEERFWFE